MLTSDATCQAPPKKIPDQWMILRRKYDPYKNTIKSIDLVKDDLTKVFVKLINVYGKVKSLGTLNTD